ncbi:MAG: transposase [Clostridia bacterium]|nr:transposase [Clostridia bacterium]
MARVARAKCESGIYHVMLRGINKQDIFLCDADRIKFLQVLKTCKELSCFDLLAYCLMGNHVHLLIKEKAETLDLIMKRIGIRFVGWYNYKYDRCGHLFQDRYRSEAVDSDEYFLTVLRYIHQNPVKANLCNAPKVYRWSSYGDYHRGEGLADVAFAFEMVNQQELLKFFDQEAEDFCLDVAEEKEVEEMRMFIAASRCKNLAEFESLNQAAQLEAIKEMRRMGLSRKRIAELTGYSDYMLRKF